MTLLLLGKAGTFAVELRADMLNRHGLIAGATGTGKTVTMQIIAEQLSRAGIPCLVPDIKGDLSGMAVPGKAHPKITERVEKMSLDFSFEDNPTRFWDVFGEHGVPLRTTISELGPTLLAQLLDLSEAQTGVLEIVFRIADDQEMLLLDLKDLTALLRHVGEHAENYEHEYGHISSASTGSIQRSLLSLEREGAELFFGEPALELEDLMKVVDGKGVVNILEAKQLYQRPKTYAIFLLWLLSELFEQLPEVGDPEKPKLVFFFDEAHLLFDDTPKALQNKIEQVVRLIRSKGVGVFFVTQNPVDLPDDVLGQLGSRVQHALRAFTPKDRKAIKAAAQNFASNPDIDVEEALTNLGVGEALISTLDKKGRPQMVQQTLIIPPRSRIGPIDESDFKKFVKEDKLLKEYGKELDRESAYEKLTKSVKKKTSEKKENKIKDASKKVKDSYVGKLGKEVGKEIQREFSTQAKRIGRNFIRGILGGFMK